MKQPKLLLRLIGIAVIAAVFFACGKPQKLFPDGDDIFGRAFPVKMQGDTTALFLSDILLPHALSKDVKIEVHEAYRLEYSDNEKKALIIARSNILPYLSELKVIVDDIEYSLVLERSRRQSYTFKFDPQGKRYRSVQIAGELNDWNPSQNPLTLINGIWQTELKLNPGKYQYQIVANGEWMLDPNNPIMVDNNVGGLNSLIEIGGDPEGKPHLSPVSFNNKEILVEVNNKPEKIFVFWNNFLLPKESIDAHGNHLHVKIPGDAHYHNRSFIRIYSYNSGGIGNDLLIPMEKGYPLTEPQNITRHDKEATILYFMMVDRFKNDNPENDDPVDDPEVFPRANYYGGDLKGIVKKIEDGYFSDLGINTVWLSPITQNPLDAYVEFPEPNRKYTGYHGYWPITLTTVDHRFGTEQDVRDMVSSAHDKDISVMLDFVSNHVHEENPIIKENPHWATQLDLDDGRKNIRIWDEHRLTTWFDTFLPSLDFDIPEVTEVMSDSAFFWIEEYNLDGFRHDATKHIPLDFWRTLTHKLRDNYMVKNDTRLFQIGETFGSRELIGSYVGNGLLDGQFDFNLYFDARSVFALDEESFQKLNYSLMQSFSYYGYNNMMGNITGNHDLPRFISLAGGALRFDEDDKEAGWQRDVGVGDESGYDKLSQITAFIMTIPGIPVLYYGDEIGLPGAGDPDSRRPMKFDNLTERELEVRNNATKLCNLRNSNLAFVYGNFETLQVTDEIYVYSRSYFDKHAVVLFNKSNESRIINVMLPNRFTNVALTENFGSETSIENGILTVELKPYGYEIMTTK